MEERRPPKPPYDPTETLNLRARYADAARRRGRGTIKVAEEYLPKEEKAPKDLSVDITPPEQPETLPGVSVRPRTINGTSIEELMGSPMGAEFDRKASTGDFSMGGRGEDYDEASGPGRRASGSEGESFRRERTDRPTESISINRVYSKVPLHMHEVYAHYWGAKTGTAPENHLGRWDTLSTQQKADWQNYDDDGIKLTSARVAEAKKDPEKFLSSNVHRQQDRLFSARELTRNMLAQPHTDSDLISSNDKVPLRTKFEDENVLLSGRTGDPWQLTGTRGGWAAEVTSRPDIDMALHNDPTHHQGVEKSISDLMRQHLDSGGTTEFGSQVSNHARLAKEAVARSARAHSLGRKKQATDNMMQAVMHINNLATAVKGQQMSAGIPVTAGPNPAVKDAATHYANYTASVANVKGLPE